MVPWKLFPGTPKLKNHGEEDFEKFECRIKDRTNKD